MGGGGGGLFKDGRWVGVGRVLRFRGEEGVWLCDDDDDDADADADAENRDGDSHHHRSCHLRAILVHLGGCSCGHYVTYRVNPDAAARGLLQPF